MRGCWGNEVERVGDLSSVGMLIAQRRRELARSQLWLANQVCAISGRATVTRHEVSRYEREIRIPAPASLPPLSVALDVPLDVLERAATETRRARRNLAGRQRHIDSGFGFCRRCRRFSPCGSDQMDEDGSISWVAQGATMATHSIEAHYANGS